MTRGRHSLHQPSGPPPPVLGSMLQPSGVFIAAPLRLHVREPLPDREPAEPLTMLSGTRLLLLATTSRPLLCMSLVLGFWPCHCAGGTFLKVPGDLASPQDLSPALKLSSCPPPHPQHSQPQPRQWCHPLAPGFPARHLQGSGHFLSSSPTWETRPVSPALPSNSSQKMPSPHFFGRLYSSSPPHSWPQQNSLFHISKRYLMKTWNSGTLVGHKDFPRDGEQNLLPFLSCCYSFLKWSTPIQLLGLISGTFLPLRSQGCFWLPGFFQNVLHLSGPWAMHLVHASPAWSMSHLPGSRFIYLVHASSVWFTLHLWGPWAVSLVHAPSILSTLHPAPCPPFAMLWLVHQLAICSCSIQSSASILHCPLLSPLFLD